MRKRSYVLSVVAVAYLLIVCQQATGFEISG
jgi:hypothetical protein